MRLAGFLDGKNGAAFVFAAFAADAMRQFALVAVGAFRETSWGEVVVAAALGGALFGVAPFWIWHDSIPFSGPIAEVMCAWIDKTSVERRLAETA